MTKILVTSIKPFVSYTVLINVGLFSADASKIVKWFHKWKKP